MTIRDMAEEVVRYLDSKYRRVLADDAALVAHSGVSRYYPNFDDVDQDDITTPVKCEADVLALYDEFDKQMVEVLGGGKWCWLVPQGDRLYRPDNLEDSR